VLSTARAKYQEKIDSFSIEIYEIEKKKRRSGLERIAAEAEEEVMSSN
jgi:hypothetical protein